jgi:tetratricopeptide (TPR) repeat protein/transglutaminase-like putative cysteine protease
MSYKFSLAAALLAGVVVSSGVSQSNTKASPVSSAPGTTPAAADYSKEAFVIERLYTQVTEESDGTGIRELKAAVKILSDAGVKAFAVLSFPYTSDNQTVDFDYVQVRKPDGTVVKTPDYNIQDMPAEVSRIAPLYSDVHEKHVAVKGLAVGDTLEYLIRVKVIKPEVSGQFWYEDSFNKTSIVQDERLEISVPKDKYVKIVSPEFKPEVTEDGGRRIYRWKHANLIVKEKDPYEIPRRTPPNPDVQVTTFASWEDVGRWYGGLQKTALTVTPAIQAKAAELTKGLKTDEEKIRALYEFVSLKYHYIGLDFGIGRYQPHAADDVLDNGYGDCKDKHTLLASLLKADGYDAWPVLIHASRKLDPDVPSPAQFNHVFTVVRLGSQYIWLDSTPEVAPYRLLLLGLRDKQALVVPTNGPPTLMTTPTNPPEPQLQEFSMEGKLDEDGTFTGHAEELTAGDAEVLFRSIFRGLPESQWKDAVQRVSQAMNFGGDVSNVKLTAPDDLDKPFQMSWDYVRKNYADWEEHKIVAPLPPMGLEVYKGAKDVKPPEPFLLGALGKVSYRSRVQLPDGYKAEAPAACHLNEAYASYDDNVKVENGVMTTNRELQIKQNEISLSDWEGYRRFGRALADDEFDYITLTGGEGSKIESGKNDADIEAMFKKGVGALQQREFMIAEDSFEKVITEDPKRPEAHYDLGVAQMSQNKLDAALAEFHKEEEISPANKFPYLMSQIIETSRGQTDAAIEEMRKLLKFDPDNQDGLANLGLLLNQAGRYSEAAQVLDKAVEESPQNGMLQYQLGSIYFKTGEKEKAMAHLKAAIDAKSDDAIVLNNVAYELAENKTDLELARDYAQQSLNKIEERSANNVSDISASQYAGQLSMIWDTMGWIYFQNAELVKAEDFVRCAWSVRQDALIGEHLGEVYEKEGKKKEAANVYELALAAIGLQPSVLAGPGGKQKQRDEITSRYQKLTGTKPDPLVSPTHRLPDGRWSRTPGEQLSQMRSVSLGKQSNVSGSAEFKIVFAPGKIDSVDFLSGEDSVRALSDKLKSAHFQLEFPGGSQAKIAERVLVSCYPTSGCTAVLMPPDTGSVSFPTQSASKQ